MSSENKISDVFTSDSSVKGRSEKKTAKYNQRIFRDWCKSCGICSAFCPNSVIERDESGSPVLKDPDNCRGCRLCELRCPDFAISIHSRDGNGGSKEQ